MKTSSNNNNNESINGMSQVINILTGETKKIRCHYLSKRTDKPVSRVLTLERLNHPALTAAGVTAWAERFNDGVNSFDWIRVSIQLTDNLCYMPNCANHDLPSIEHYNDYDNVNRRNVDNFFQSIADKPAKMMTGEDWPNMAVIAAYRAAGRAEEADTLTAARDIYNARREADKEALSKKYAAQQYYYNSPKPNNFDELTELEKAQYMMETAQECAKDHPELDWADILEKAEKRLEKAKKEEEKAIREAEKAAKVRESYKTGLLVTDKKFGLDYERITGIEEGMNTYIVTTATKIQVECMKHYRVMEKAKNEHTVSDLPEWVRPGAVLMINGTWKWEEVEIVELADGCVWYKKGNSVMGWTYDHFISLYVNHRYAKVKEYAPEPTLEDIGKFRAMCEAEGCTYPGDVEGTIEYYRDTLLTAEDGKTVSYQFGNCRFDCKRNESGTWDVHAYDTDGEDTTFEGRTASFFGGMFNDLFKTWGSGNLPEQPKEIIIEDATLQDSGEIKPKAAFQIGDRVERKSDGERGTMDGYNVTDGKLTYIVKYDRTQHRESDGFEYLSEELNGDELRAA